MDGGTYMTCACEEPEREKVHRTKNQWMVESERGRGRKARRIRREENENEVCLVRGLIGPGIHMLDRGVCAHPSHGRNGQLDRRTQALASRCP